MINLTQIIKGFKIEVVIYFITNKTYMNQPNEQTLQIKPKTPILVIIIAWILLFSAFWSLLSSMSNFYILGTIISGEYVGDPMGPQFKKDAPLILVKSILGLIKAALLFIISFGLRFLKKWAVYLFAILTIISILAGLFYYFNSRILPPFSAILSITIQFLMLIYLWSILKNLFKFK